MGRVVIGMDPHKRSATIEVIDEHEQVLAHGRYGTDTNGYRAMLAAGCQFPERVWAVEGCAASAGTLPNAWSRTAKTSWTCRQSCRLGCGYSTPVRVARPTRSTRTVWLWPDYAARPAHRRGRGRHRRVALLVDRRDELGRARTETISRIHHLLLELVPGGAKKFLTRGQASYLLRTAPAPVGIAAQTLYDPVA